MPSCALRHKLFHEDFTHKSHPALQGVNALAPVDTTPFVNHVFDIIHGREEKTNEDGNGDDAVR